MEILAVVAVAACAALYAIADFIERRRRHKFNEELRRYIQKHKDDGIVVEVSIDGETDYKKNAKWEDTVPVEITAYKLKQLDVTMEVSVSGEEGKPVFIVQTNLPDGLKLDFTLRSSGGYAKAQDARIENGKAESQPFTDNGAELKGDYTLTVTMTLTGQGFLAPMGAIGNGDVLAGDLISTDKDGRPCASTEYAYSSNFEPAISEEDMAALLEMVLANDSDMSYEVTPYDDGFIVDTWSDGVADGAAYAKLGISPYKEMALPQPRNQCAAGSSPVEMQKATSKITSRLCGSGVEMLTWASPLQPVR